MREVISSEREWQPGVRERIDVASEHEAKMRKFESSDAGIGVNDLTTLKSAVRV